MILLSPIPGAALSSDGYGPRAPIVTPGGTTGAFHYGQDFDLPAWTPIRAAAAGRVTVSGRVGTFGNAVYIDHGEGVVTRYAHMIAPPPVGSGWYVEQGDVIGYVGSTGASTGNHLHFEVVVNGVRVDPVPYLTTTKPPPTGPKEQDDDMTRPMTMAKVTTGSNVEVTTSWAETGEERVFGSTNTKDGQAYNRNIALAYGCAPECPIVYVTASHYDRVRQENAATRARLDARA